MNPNMTSKACRKATRAFSAYLDSTLTGREMQSVGQHLDSCAPCAQDFAAWRATQHLLAEAGPVPIPQDLGLRLRLAISHESARRQAHWYQPIWLESLATRWQNLVRPLVLQASAGLAGAVVLLGTIALLLGGLAAPEAVLANDEPLGALTKPHFLYAEARIQPVTTPQDTTIVVQADINAEGRVYDYSILSGPDDATTNAALHDQLNNQLMVLVYQPAKAFDLPVRGHVLITFSGVSVHA